MPRSLTRTTPRSANRKLVNFLFLFWILGLFPQFGHAQEVGMRPGVRAGLAMTTQGGEDVPPSLGWRTGGSVGALAEASHGPRCSGSNVFLDLRRFCCVPACPRDEQDAIAGRATIPLDSMSDRRTDP